MPYRKSVADPPDESSEQGRSRSAAERRDRAQPPKGCPPLPRPLAIPGRAPDEEGRRDAGLARAAGLGQRRAVSSACSLNIYNPIAGLVGRGGREDLRGRRELPQHVRHRHRGLLRLRLGRQSPLHEPVPRPDPVRRPGQQGEQQQCPLPDPRLRAVPQIARLRHRGLALGGREDPVRHARLLLRGARGGIEPGVPDLSARKVHPKPPVKRRAGRDRGRGLKVKAKTAGDVPDQDMRPFGDAWSARSSSSGSSTSPAPGSTWSCPSTKAGTYALSAAFTKAGDYGIVQLALDGKPLGRPIDLYEPSPRWSTPEPSPLGRPSWTGDHTLSITIDGQEPQEHQLPRRPRLDQARPCSDESPTVGHAIASRIRRLPLVRHAMSYPTNPRSLRIFRDSASWACPSPRIVHCGQFLDRSCGTRCGMGLRGGVEPLQDRERRPGPAQAQGVGAHQRRACRARRAGGRSCRPGPAGCCSGSPPPSSRRWSEFRSSWPGIGLTTTMGSPWPSPPTWSARPACRPPGRRPPSTRPSRS